MRPTDSIVCLLSAAAGAIDALSFLGFNVFTSAMSGNTVLLGIAIGQRALRPAVNAGVALLFYGLGVLAATAIRNKAGSDKSGLRLVLILEAPMLAGFATLAFVYTPRAAEAVENTMIAMAALGMGAQAIAARCVKAPGINTVVFTSTLTSIAEALGRVLIKRPEGIQSHTWRQIAAYMSYASGAILGGFLSNHGSVGTLIPVSCTLAALVLSLILSGEQEG